MNHNYSREIPEKWVTMAKVFEAMGDENRQRILLTFEKNEEINIKDIVEVSNLGRTAVVHHLKILENAKVITGEKRGKFYYYKINPHIILQTCENTIDYVKKNLI